jgi:FG-GAP-like repeat
MAGGGFYVEDTIHGTGPNGTPSPSGTVQFVDRSLSNAVLATEPVVGELFDAGAFHGGPPYPATGSKPFSIAASDFSHDGISDLVVANSGGDTVSVLLGNGDGTFQTQTTQATGAGPFEVVTGNLSGLGRADLATANSVGDSVTLLVNQGNGTFTSRIPSAFNNGPIALAVADLNGDGMADLAVLNNSGGSVWILANGSGPVSTAGNGASFDVPGTNVVVGEYSGDSTFAAENSSPITVTSPPLTDSLALVSSANPTNYGSSLLLSATMTAPANAFVSSDGVSISFKSGSTALGTGTLESCVATLAASRH